MSYPTPNQGQTSGDPSEIECPSCGRGNDITGDPEKEGDVHDCAHCDESFEITGVDYRVTVTVKALPKKDAICGRCGDRFISRLGATSESEPGKRFCSILCASAASWGIKVSHGEDKKS